MNESKEITAQEAINMYLESGCKHQDLFQENFQQSWLDERFLRALEIVKSNGSMKKLMEEGLLNEILPNVFSLPVFTSEICNKIIEETESYLEFAAERNIQVYRPNSMNKYGLVLNQIGMFELLTDFQQKFLHVISRALFPIEASHFTSHHSFIVSYSPDTDRALDMHTDDSDITWNICLGKEGFEGSGLTFCGVMAQPNHRKLQGQYTHLVGHAVVHLGSQRHGADSILSGERHNLIMWSKNDVYRNSSLFEDIMKSYHSEEGPPDPLCLSYTHDRDYLAFKEYPDGANPYRKLFQEDADENMTLPWCPPQNFGYKGMLSHNKLMLLHYERECVREDCEKQHIRESD
jgi:hypothetical protein